MMMLPASIPHIVRAMAGKDDDTPGAPGVGIATRTRAKPKKPSMYKVLLLNDDYTPMEFVVMVLQRFFNMDIERATQVMLHHPAASSEQVRNSRCPSRMREGFQPPLRAACSA